VKKKGKRKKEKGKRKKEKKEKTNEHIPFGSGK